eukprot:snap_masked-scaffold_1-processed-gene-4.34-mRNA-1 protein AED:1.00 eAED:1.00 QI:0/-1/0/0/-1/1/1/0/292
MNMTSYHSSKSTRNPKFNRQSSKASIQSSYFHTFVNKVNHPQTSSRGNVQQQQPLYAASVTSFQPSTIYTKTKPQPQYIYSLSIKIKYVVLLTLLILFAAGVAIIFPREPNFTQDTSNIEFKSFDLKGIELTLPLIFENVNFLPLEILEIDSIATFKEFAIKINLDEPVKLPARANATGTARLKANFEDANVFGSIIDFLGLCIFGSDPLEGVVTADAVGRYLGLEAAQTADPEIILLECPIGRFQSHVEGVKTLSEGLDLMEVYVESTTDNTELKANASKIFRMAKTYAGF